MAITTFIPEVWAARLLEHYNRNNVLANLVNRNYEGDISQFGDTVHINSLNNLTVKDYTPNSEIDKPEQLTTVDQTLVIDHGKYYNFYVDDVDKVQARGDLMDAAMARAAVQLSDDTEDYLLATILAGAGKSVSGTPTAETVYAEILKMKTEMDKLNVPRAGRHLVVSPDIEALVLQDNRFVASNGQPSEDRLVNGYVARAAGFDIYMSTAVEGMVAFVSDAVTFANQLTKTEAYRPESQFADAVKGLNLCGAKVILPEYVVKYTVA
jgi:hypothetical protein